MSKSALSAVGTLALVVCAASTPVSAEQYEQGPYIGISAGYLGVSDNDGDISGTEFDVEYDDGFGLGVQLGYKHWVWRLEAEFEYGQSGYEEGEVANVNFDIDGDFDIFRWTGSIYYDFDAILTKYIPYIGGGIGLALVDVDEVTIGAVTVEGDDDTYFTAHGEVGMSFELSPELDIVPAYRLLYLDTGGNGVDDDTAHLFKLGLRYGF